ncbi:MAG: N-acetylneuraminate synthase family protein [Flavobacteriales bacterium]
MKNEAPENELVKFLQRSSSPCRNYRKPYLIAEAGVNHEGSMDTAKRLIEEAVEGGAQAIKFQTYKAERIAAKDSPAYWDLSQESTPTQYELFKKYDKFWKKEYEELKSHCDRADIEFLSTPFDTGSAEFLNELMPAFKVSSSDLNNIPFIERLAAFGKPILLSTGAAYMWELQKAVDAIDDYGVPLCLMHCVLSYPTDDKDANLGMLMDLKKKFPERTMGYSDHTMPGEMEVLRTSWLMGAEVIEKHFTHDKELPGNDHYHAMNREDLKRFWEKVDRSMTLMGRFDKLPLEEEASARKNARRSLVTRREVPKGKALEAEDLTWKRPAHGIAPDRWEEVLGRKVQEDLSEDHVLDWEDLGAKAEH